MTELMTNEEHGQYLDEMLEFEVSIYRSDDPSSIDRQSKSEIPDPTRPVSIVVGMGNPNLLDAVGFGDSDTDRYKPMWDKRSQSIVNTLVKNRDYLEGIEGTIIVPFDNDPAINFFEDLADKNIITRGLDTDIVHNSGDATYHFSF